MSRVAFIPKSGQMFFHGTSIKFTNFKSQQPEWFTPTQSEALAHVQNLAKERSQSSTYTKVCKLRSGKIANDKQAWDIAKLVWPNEKRLMRSMFDQFSTEYKKEDVHIFITLLTRQKYIGVVYGDYSAQNKSNVAYVLVVFDAPKVMSIIDEWTYSTKGSIWVDRAGENHMYDGT